MKRWLQVVFFGALAMALNQAAAQNWPERAEAAKAAKYEPQ